MATKIPTGSAAYLVDFENGQGGAAADYFTYAPDMDTNFLLLRQTVNQVIDEINAAQGPNSLAALDLVLWDDPVNPLGTLGATDGLVGRNSYRPEIQGTPTTLNIARGVAFVARQRVQLLSEVIGQGPISDTSGAGAPFRNWIALDNNGGVFLTSEPGQKTLDIYTVEINLETSPTAFVAATELRLAEMLFDGDAYASLINRPASGVQFPAKEFESADERIAEIENAISGGGPDPGSIAVPAGTEALPGLTFDNPSNGSDTTTGWFRQAADVWAWSQAGTERLRLLAGAHLFADGVVADPAYSFLADTDTGVYRIGNDRLGLATNGTLRLECDAEGNVDLPTNMGAIVRRAVDQTISTGVSPTQISWDTEDRDIGAWIAVTATDLTVPTGGDGLYAITLEVEWEEAGTGAHTGQRLLGIEAAGTTYAVQRIEAVTSELTNQATSVIVELVATDVVRGLVAHDSGSDEDINTARLAIQKIA